MLDGAPLVPLVLIYLMWDTSIPGFQVGNFKVLLRQEIAFCRVQCLT